MEAHGGRARRTMTGAALAVVVTAVAAVAVGTGLASTSDGKWRAGAGALISETFDTETSAGYFVAEGGSWSVVDGEFRLDDPADSENANANLAIHETPVPANFTLTLESTVDDTEDTWNDFSVVFGYADPLNYVFVSLNESADELTNGIFTVTGGQQRRLVGFKETLTPGARAKVTVERRGPAVSVTLDGAALGSATVNGFATGQVGFGTRNDAASFDNFVVRVPEPTTAAGPTPSIAPNAPAPPSASVKAAAPTTAKKSTPPPTTARPGGKPTAANTGVPAGTRLTVRTGDQVLSTPNQVLSGIDFKGYVRITAKNVTIRNSVFRGGAKKCNAATVMVEDGASAVITDSEIVPTNPNACLDGVWATDATLSRMDISGVVDGVKAYDDTIVEDSYIHDLSRFASDPNQGGGPTHNDAVQSYEGDRNVTLRRNNLDLTDSDNAAYQVTQDGGGKAGNLRVENNWLNGGGCTLNFAHKGGPTPMTGIFVVGNKFGRDSAFDCPILISTKTVLSQNSGNVFADTGKAIGPPQQHD